VVRAFEISEYMVDDGAFIVTARVTDVDPYEGASVGTAEGETVGDTVGMGVGEPGV